MSKIKETERKREANEEQDGRSTELIDAFNGDFV